jgi:integrase
MQKVSAKFVFNTYKKQSGKHGLLLRLILNRKKKYIYTGIDLFPDQWDDPGQRIVKHADKQELNIKLRQFLKKVDEITIESILTNKDLSLNSLAAKIKNKNVNSFYIWAMAELNKMGIKETTRRGYAARLNKLNQWRPGLTFKDIDFNLINDYYNFLKSELKDTTTGRQMVSIKYFVELAKKQGLIHTSPFEGIKIKRPGADRDFLTIDEVKRLRALLVDGSLSFNQGLTLRAFLFACFSGLRYGDLKRLTWDMIQDQAIRLIQAKTQAAVFIPLPDPAIELLPEQAPGLVFKVFSNQKTNKHLKDIAIKANIQKVLSFHVARHTYATMSISLGVPVEVVSKLMGHKSIQITQIYARILEEKKREEIKKLNF